MKLSDGKWLSAVLADLQKALAKHGARITNMQDVNVVRARKKSRMGITTEAEKTEEAGDGERVPLCEDALRTNLKRRGMKIVDLARELGVSGPTIHAWMHGSALGYPDAPKRMVKRMAWILHVKFDALVMKDKRG